MLEPVSLLGAIAAATQLAKYGFEMAERLSEYPGHLRNAPVHVSDLLVEVDSFLAMSQMIQSHPLFLCQGTDINALIHACIRPATSLQCMLQPLAITNMDDRYVRLKKAVSFQRKMNKIKKLLGDIQRRQGTLSFHLLVAYMVSTSMLPLGYSRMGQESKDERDVPSSPESTTCRDQDHSISTNLSLLPLDQLRYQNPLSFRLLCFLVCLGVGDIPLSLLPVQLHNTAAPDALKLLEMYSLVESKPNSGCFSVQQAVRTKVQGYLAAQHELESYLLKAMTHVDELFPLDTFSKEDIDSGRVYLPHATYLYKSYNVSDGVNVAPGNTSTQHCLATKLTRHLREMGKYEEATVFAEQAVSISVEAYGPLSSSTLDSHRNVAALYSCLGYIDRAAKSLEDILRVQTSIEEEAHAGFIILCDEMALALQDQGRYAEAEGFHYRAISLSIERYGMEHLKTLGLVHNLSLTLYYQHRYAEAQEWLQQIADSMEQQYSLEHVMTLSALHSLGIVLQCQGDLDGAFKAYSRALFGRENLLGPQHPDTIATKANLCELYRQQGSLPLAEKSTREVLSLYQATLPHEHPRTLTTLGNLAILLQCQEKYEEAAQMTRTVIEARKRKLGPEHPDTLMSMSDLAVIYHYQDDIAGALELAEAVLESRRRGLDEGHEDRVASEVYVMDLREELKEWSDERRLVGCWKPTA